MNYTAIAVTIVGLVLLLVLLVAADDMPFIVQLGISVSGGAIVGIPMERIRQKRSTENDE